MTSLQRLKTIYRATAVRSVQLNSFKGSLLRGIFGTYFKQLVCSFNSAECHQCPPHSHCSFPLFFPVDEGGNKSGAPPFILFSPDEVSTLNEGDGFVFECTLFGEALSLAPFVTKSLILGLERKGLHVDIIEATNDTLTSSSAFPCPLSYHSVELEFISPLRVKENGRLISDLSWKLIFSSLIRRLSHLFSHFNAEPLIPLAQECRACHIESQWKDFTRLSNRQRSLLQIGGIIGKIHIDHVKTPLLQALYLGSEVHIGKQTTFGLGKYRVKELV